MKQVEEMLRTTPVPNSIPDNLESQITEVMAQARVPGLSLTIFSKKEILYSGGFGVKSLENPEPIDPETLFCAASLGKPVFAYAVLILVDQGILEMDKPLYQYLPHNDLQHDSRHQMITARMVLKHTTGLPNWREDKNLEFISDPDEQYTYSGEGFLYLMKVVELLCGQTLDEIMKELVFDPLGMTHSSYTWQDRFEANYAQSHNETGRILFRYKPDHANAAYSLQTTAPDYARLMMALLNGTGLKEETACEFFQPAVEVARSPLDNSFASWGLGIGLMHTGEKEYCWQWGGHNWFASLTLASIQSGIGMVYFSNSINGFGIGKVLAGLCLGQDEILEMWLGDYDYQTPAKTLQRNLLQYQQWESCIAPFMDANQLHQNTDLIDEESMEKVGHTLSQLGERRLALKIFQLNKLAYPHSPQAQENYAHACVSCHRQKEAARAFAQAFELDSSKTHCQEIYLQLSGQQTGNVTFRIEGHYSADCITVAGEFNGWNPTRHPFRREAGEWICQLQLAPGTYQYKFVIDGIWTLDSANPKSIFDLQHNSVLEVQ